MNSRIFALLIAPAVPSLLVGLIQMFLGGEWSAAFMGCLFLWYPSAIALGLPIHIFARESGWTRSWHLVLLFALLGTVVPLLLLTLLLATGSAFRGVGSGALGATLLRLTPGIDWLRVCVFGSFFGAASGATFAFILRRPFAVERNRTRPAKA